MINVIKPVGTDTCDLRYRFARAHPVKMTGVGWYHEGRACGECLEFGRVEFITVPNVEGAGNDGIDAFFRVAMGQHLEIGRQLHPVDIVAGWLLRIAVDRGG